MKSGELRVSKDGFCNLFGITRYKLNDSGGHASLKEDLVN